MTPAPPRPKLSNRRNGQILAEVVEARSFLSRLRGLMFRPHWDSHQTLWIHRCNSIHTGFCHFAIDAVFVDREFQVKKIARGLRPWRVVPPVLGASSVFEFTAHHPALQELQIGDQLDVGP